MNGFPCPAARILVLGAVAALAPGCAETGDPRPTDPASRPAPAAAPEPLEAALARAAAEGKRVVVDFRADWCGPCREMDAKSWPDARVKAALGDFVFLDVDVDAHPDAAARYGVRAIPTVLVLSAAGEALARSTGFRGPGDLASFLEGAPPAPE